MKIFPRLLVAFACIIVTSTFAQDAAVPEKEVKDFDWCTITVPKTAPGDAPVEGVIKIKGDLIKEDCELRVDLHKFVGKNRVPGAGKAKPVALKAGESKEIPVSFKVPADANGLAFVVYTMPTGAVKFSEASHKASAGVKITR